MEPIKYVYPTVSSGEKSVEDFKKNEEYESARMKLWKELFESQEISRFSCIIQDLEKRIKEL